MSMERHTLRAVKLTQNIFELNRVNKELVVVRKIIEDLEFNNVAQVQKMSKVITFPNCKTAPKPSNEPLPRAA